MNKAAIWMAGVAITAVVGMIATGLTWWAGRINDDHETLKQLWWKDQYINGAVSAAPVTAPKK